MVHVENFRAYCIKPLEINGAIVCHEQKRYCVRVCIWGGKSSYQVEPEQANILLTQEEFDEHFRRLPNKLKVKVAKHGLWTWSQKDDCWICDNCENSALNNYRGNSTDSPYCPHCGKKMYEVESEFE